jgi:hypothetical protein
VLANSGPLPGCVSLQGTVAQAQALPARYAKAAQLQFINLPNTRSTLPLLVALYSARPTCSDSTMTSKTEARHRKRKRGPRSKPAKASSDPPDLFTIFNELPKEIRLMIWEAALPGPRIVHVTQARLKSSRFGRWRVRSDRLVEDKCFKTEQDREDNYLWITDRHQRVKDRKKRRSRDDEDSGWDTDDDRLCEAYPGRPPSCWGYRTHCPNPAMLLACRESYDVASKVVGSDGGVEPLERGSVGWLPSCTLWIPIVKSEPLLTRT